MVRSRTIRPKIKKNMGSYYIYAENVKRFTLECQISVYRKTKTYFFHFDIKFLKKLVSIRFVLEDMKTFAGYANYHSTVNSEGGEGKNVTFRKFAAFFNYVSLKYHFIFNGERQAPSLNIRIIIQLVIMKEE